MRVCTVVASTCGLHDRTTNDARLRVAVEVIRWARGQHGADLVVLPAGYLTATVPSPEAAVEACTPLLAASSDAGIAVVVGVDGQEDGKTLSKAEVAERIAAGTLPFFGVVQASNDPPSVVRQRSTTSTNWPGAPKEPNNDARSFEVHGARVGVLLCGEAFSPPIRTTVVGAGLGLVVIAAHYAAGMRLPRTLGHIAAEGTPAIRAVHAANGAVNRLWIGDERRAPVVGPRAFGADVWALASVFELAPPNL